jgi:hypothetical protein
MGITEVDEAIGQTAGPSGAPIVLGLYTRFPSIRYVPVIRGARTNAQGPSLLLLDHQASCVGTSWVISH